MLNRDGNHHSQIRPERIEAQTHRITTPPRKKCEPTWCQLRRALVVLVCLSSTFALTQDSPRSEGHPKVGLVLEGGGALGLAHIGVIQYLEEHHMTVKFAPIEYDLNYDKYLRKYLEALGFPVT